jgi:hypothetical protein
VSDFAPRLSVPLVAKELVAAAKPLTEKQRNKKGLFFLTGFPPARE